MAAAVSSAGRDAATERRTGELKGDLKATRPNDKWLSDITHIPTREGWLYLVSVMDLFSPQVVGWAMGEHHHADPAGSALDMAIRRARGQQRA